MFRTLLTALPMGSTLRNAHTVPNLIFPQKYDFFGNHFPQKWVFCGRRRIFQPPHSAYVFWKKYFRILKLKPNNAIQWKKSEQP